MSVVEELSGDGSRIVTSWKRTTVADGDWLQHNTIGPLNERDVFLAEKIDELSGNSDEKLNEEIEARKNADTFLSGTIDTFSGNYETFKSKTEGNIDYLSGSIDGLKEDLDTEIEDRSREDGLLQAQIDTIKAATDVIMVYGDYHTFTANSGDLILTDADVIKVLVDESTNDKQVYYQWYDPKLEHEWSGWSGIGSLDPYYSVSEIDEYKEEVDDKFDSLSATVANNYLSANNTAVSAGKNIIVTNETGTKVGIKTKDDVSFSSVSAKGFSGTNLSGLNQNDTIDNLFGSAYSGAEASAWINDNSARLDIQAGYGLETGEDDDGHLVIGLHQERCDYNKYGLALGSWCTAHTINIGNASFAFGESCVVTGGQGTIAAGSNVDITGRFSVGLGDASNINGNYSYSIGEQNNLTADRQYAFGQGLSGNSFMIGRYNEVEPNAQFVIGGGTTGAYSVTSHKNLLVIKNDVISARDFSAGNVSLSSLTNLSALGNGITNTARFNLSAVKLSAGEGIGFKNDANGVLSISAEGRAYTGENYVKVDNTTKKIGLSGDLVGSAESGQSAYNWITAQSATLSAGFGIQFTSASQNTMGIKLNAILNEDDKIVSIGGKELVGGGISSISVPGSVFTGSNVNFYAGDNIDFTTANNSLTINLNDNIFLNGGVSESKQIYLITTGEDIDAAGPQIAILNTYQSQLHLYNNKIVRDGKSTTWDKVISAGNSIPIVVGSTGTDLNTLYIY